MSVTRRVMCGLVACVLMGSAAEAQYTTLDHTIVDGSVAPASMGALGGYGASCGLPEPACGAVGLGYGGGFGSCGSCASCGTGGFMNRNLHQVQPCACGGSVIADLARGAVQLVDRTVSCVLGGIFGGLQSVTCHASGSFAALQSAAMGGCATCGGGCDAGGCTAAPGCGVAVESSMPYVGSGSYPSSHPVISEPTLAPYQPTPQSLHGAPRQPAPLVTPSSDPFIDDPPAIPQAGNRGGSGSGIRYYNPRQQVQPATSVQPAGSMIGSAVQRAIHNVSPTRLQSQSRRPAFRR